MPSAAYETDGNDEHQHTPQKETALGSCSKTSHTVEDIGQGAYELGNIAGDDMVLAGANSGFGQP
jgi:hypothetical protein